MNHLKANLGRTGNMIQDFSQTFVVKHMYVIDGACLSICAKFMSDFHNMVIPTEQDYLEAAQWIQQMPGRINRVNEMITSSGLQRIDSLEGSLYQPMDEIALSSFLQKIGSRPSWNIFSFVNTQRTEGHALLFYIWGESNSTDWIMFDPNFGLAKWPHLGGLLVSLKELLTSDAYAEFGPYYRFTVSKYEKL